MAVSHGNDLTYYNLPGIERMLNSCERGVLAPPGGIVALLVQVHDVVKDVFLLSLPR